jgi:hypothetical protein
MRGQERGLGALRKQKTPPADRGRGLESRDGEPGCLPESLHQAEHLDRLERLLR